MVEYRFHPGGRPNKELIVQRIGQAAEAESGLAHTSRLTSPRDASVPAGLSKVAVSSNAALWDLAISPKSYTYETKVETPPFPMAADPPLRPISYFAAPTIFSLFPPGRFAFAPA
jgi:hypothetical protein